MRTSNHLAMKKIFIILFTACNSMVFGQSRSISKSIHDDGKSMSIHFSGTVDGQTINYDQTFDLSFLDKSEQLALKENILDSLDLSFAPVLESPIALLLLEDEPEPVIPVKVPKVSVSKELNNVQSQKADKKQCVFKEVKYNSEGEMYLHYKFVKNGEDFEYERTLNVTGKSEKERQRIMMETEQEVGISPVK